MKTTLLFAMFTLGSALLAADIPATFRAATPIILELNQQQRLNDDAPFIDVIFADQGAIWIATPSAIWYWQITRKNLVRMPMPLNKGETIERLLATSSGLIIATNQNLLQLSLNPKKLIRMATPPVDPKRTLALAVDGNIIWWITKTGIIRVSADGDPIVLDVQIPQLATTQKAVLDVEKKSIWMIEGGQLVVSYLPPAVDTKKTSRIVHAAKEEFIDLRYFDGHVFAHTNHTVLVFSTSDESLKQVVPVDDHKKLLAFDINAKIHAYLFNDTLLDSFVIGENARKQSWLKLPKNSMVEKMINNDEFSVVLMEKNIVVFK